MASRALMRQSTWEEEDAPSQQRMLSESGLSGSDDTASTDGSECAVSGAVFLPGPIGLNAHWETGVVKYVEPGGQAHRQGVQVGWVLHEVDDDPYSEELLDRKRTGGQEYGIAFRDSARGQHSCSVSCCLFGCFCRGPIAEAIAGWPCCGPVCRVMAACSSAPCLHWCPELVSFCLFCCGSGATDGYKLDPMQGDLPQSSYYDRIVAGWPLKPLDALLSIPMHIKRSASMGQLTTSNIVSKRELALMMERGMLKNPSLRDPVAFPIMNFVVWRRSAMYVLVTISFFLMVFTWVEALSHVTLAGEDIQVIDHALPEYDDWTDSLEVGEAATYKSYVKYAVGVMFDKLLAETSWYFIIKEYVRAIIKSAILVPLLVAALTWMNWQQSCWALRAGWVLMVAMPFVTSTIPARLLVDFEKAIVADVVILKEETRLNYNLDDKLDNAMEGVLTVCGTNPLRLRQVGTAVAGARKAAAASYTSLTSLCKLTRRLHRSWLIKHFTSYGDEAHEAHVTCLRAKEGVEQAGALAVDKHAESEVALLEAYKDWEETCSDVADIRAALTLESSTLKEQQREVQDLARFIVNDGVAGVTEGLNMAVGAINALASFRSLWPAALSLGPGILKGAVRAKTIVPEASLPGAFIIILPWIYAPLSWALFNSMVQLFGNWALLWGMLSFTFYPLFISLVGMCFRVYAPQTREQLYDTLRIFRRIETSAVVMTFVFIFLFVYLAVMRYQAAQKDHPLLRALSGYLLEESLEFRKFIRERYLKFDLLDWVLKHPGTVFRHTLDSTEPLVSFLQKFLLTSIVSTDWMLSRVAYERRFEYLVMNRDCLPYHTTQANVEELIEARRKRLDAVVLAFGGAVGEDDRKARDMCKFWGKK